MPVSYPLIIPVKPYTGKDQRKIVRYQAALDGAAKIEKYLNERYVKGQPTIFGYYEIAQDLGMSKERVRDILYPVDCGSNGITF